jgi:hypothetical protein
VFKRLLNVLTSERSYEQFLPTSRAGSGVVPGSIRRLQAHEYWPTIFLGAASTADVTNILSCSGVKK